MNNKNTSEVKKSTNPNTKSAKLKTLNSRFVFNGDKTLENITVTTDVIRKIRDKITIMNQGRTKFILSIVSRYLKTP